MKGRTLLTSRSFLSTLALLLALTVGIWIGCGEQTQAPTGVQETQEIVLSPSDPQVKAVMQIQNRHTEELMERPGIVGTATGMTKEGRPAIIVLAQSQALAKAAAIPPEFEDVPVEIKYVGEIKALKGPPNGGKTRPSDRFDRPVPIGVSTGNEEECSAGTIACRVRSGRKVYALSNNHVYALENDASENSQVLQPGRYDTNCNTDPNDVIGTLTDFEPIVFSETANNTIDAAIALSSTANLGTATPSDGYGVPKSTVEEAAIGLAVQKYGRTTALTKGTVTAINVTVRVGYSSGVARFVNQLFIEAEKPLLMAGDSGSLVVTDPNRNPVGLLFAGTASGQLGVANPIDLVLSKFHIKIDGE